MLNLSRRSLARYATDSMIAGVPSSDIAQHLAAALIATKKTKQVNQLLEDIAYELEERKLAVNALVSTAHGLDASIRTQIEKFITEKSGAKEISLNETIDSSLIGGVHIETAHFSWDKTIKRKLTDIEGAF